ncbi:MAG: oligosaccharide flippase family protein [Pseudomonadota bacterium]|nr:oligosaccharide flippase family protein [Pseudomonadota bacterium]
MARKSAFITLGTQVGIQSIGLVTGILVARFLGPEGRGELAAVVVWVSMIAYLGNLGLPAASAYAAARDAGRVRTLMGNGFVAVLVQWPLLAGVGLLVLYLALDGYTDLLQQLAVAYLCLYIPLNLLTLYANATQQGLGHYARFNAVRLCVPVSYLVGLGMLVWLEQFTVAGVLAANLFSNFVTLLLALGLLLPRARVATRRRWIDLPALRRDLRYGLSAHIGMLQPFTGLQVDVLLLTLLLPAHDLGLYMAALAGAGLIRAQGVALGMVAMPEVARQKESAGQFRTVVRFASFAALFGGATALFLAWWAQPLVALAYGDAFSGAASALRLLALGALTASLNRVLADGLRGMGRPLSGTAAELASLAVGVPAILVLAPSGGAEGASLATVLASASALAITAWSLYRRRAAGTDPAALSVTARPLIAKQTDRP